MPCRRKPCIILHEYKSVFSSHSQLQVFVVHWVFFTGKVHFGNLPQQYLLYFIAMLFLFIFLFLSYEVHHELLHRMV